MLDHVGVAVSDLATSTDFYRRVLIPLGIEISHEDAGLVEWNDWCLAPVDDRHGLTTNLHVGFRAADRAAVEAFWRAGIDAGYQNAGAPGERPQYSPYYYAAYLLDPDGNSIEAVYDVRADPVPDGCVDHLWVRVQAPQVTKAFYATIAGPAGLTLTRDEPRRVQFTGSGFSLTFLSDRQPATEHLHYAFRASSHAQVNAFHAAALEGGYVDNGPPDERPYHPGYYAAFVLDPDGVNVEVVDHGR